MVTEMIDHSYCYFADIMFLVPGYRQIGNFSVDGG